MTCRVICMTAAPGPEPDLADRRAEYHRRDNVVRSLFAAGQIYPAMFGVYQVSIQQNEGETLAAIRGRRHPRSAWQLKQDAQLAQHAAAFAARSGGETIEQQLERARSWARLNELPRRRRRDIVQFPPHTIRRCT